MSKVPPVPLQTGMMSSDPVMKSLVNSRPWTQFFIELRDCCENVNSSITDLSNQVNQNTSDIQSNATQIAINSQNITQNTIAINSNSQAISDLETSGSGTQAQVDANTQQIAINTADISQNASDISANASQISINTGNISTNTTSISNNSAQISTNTSNISTNASDISDLQTEQIFPNAQKRTGGINVTDGTDDIGIYIGSLSRAYLENLSGAIWINSSSQIDFRLSGTQIASVNSSGLTANNQSGTGNKLCYLDFAGTIMRSPIDVNSDDITTTGDITANKFIGETESVFVGNGSFDQMESLNTLPTYRYWYKKFFANGSGTYTKIYFFTGAQTTGDTLTFYIYNNSGTQLASVAYSCTTGNSIGVYSATLSSSVTISAGDNYWIGVARGASLSTSVGYQVFLNSYASTDKEDWCFVYDSATPPTSLPTPDTSASSYYVALLGN